MGENPDTTSKFRSDSIAEILQERTRLDELLEQKFRKKMAILFTDVCGATRYMSAKGDIGGQAWLQKHHDIVFSAIENKGGKVENLIGDGIVASFVKSISAIEASIAIQKGLQRNNLDIGSSDDEIHVRIGINSGELLRDKELVAGDVVNVASRIVNLAEPDQILISESVCRESKASRNFHCRFHETTQVKGVNDPLRLYRVFWKEEGISDENMQKITDRITPPSQGILHPQVTFRIEVALEGQHIRICSYEQVIGEEDTVHHYEKVPVPIDRIQKRNQELVKILNRANQKGKISPDIPRKIREIGQTLSDELFTKNVKEKLRETSVDHLILNLDERLVHVPWELLFDGNEFLCQRFNMGRTVRTRQDILGGKGRVLSKPFDMLILADPLSDLKGAYQEGIQLRDFLDGHMDSTAVSLLTGNITPDTIREKIRNFDLVHFAGHADYFPENPGQSGWRLLDGTFTADEIRKMGGTANLPALIFSNACQSARSEIGFIKETFQDEIFGLANAFILTGVKHYVGTFWDIIDESSQQFALEFYKQLLTGVTVGQAMRGARRYLIEKYGDESIVWASYVLYGDPTHNYMDHVNIRNSSEDTAVPAGVIPSTPSKTKIRAGNGNFSKNKPFRQKNLLFYVFLFIFLSLLSVGLWVYPSFLKTNFTKYETTVLNHYQLGNFDEALKASKTLLEKNPESGLGYLIQGNVYLRKKKLGEAERGYKKVIGISESTDFEKAKALVGLGRIASIRKQSDDALKYYQSATLKNPKSVAGYLSQAAILEDKGDYQQALDLLAKAQISDGENLSIGAFINETKRKLAFASDVEKREDIDRLVKELLSSGKPPSTEAPSDEWTSFPLTMWILDFKTKGFPIQEGGEKFLISCIGDQLLKGSRVKPVERAILDKLLAEMKLGTSALVDRSTAISLGRLLAAKLILFGQILYSGSQTQVSARIIETETGSITATFNEVFGNAVPVSAIAETLSAALSNDLEKLYPLRGKFSSLEDGKIILNIGEETGVRTKMKFRAVGADSVIEIMSVGPKESSAKAISGKKLLKRGMHVQIEQRRLH